MTLREIDRQYKHWATFPPLSFSAVRIGQALGIAAPEPRDSSPEEVTSEAELRTLAASLGVTGGR